MGIQKQILNTITIYYKITHLISIQVATIDVTYLDNYTEYTATERVENVRILDSNLQTYASIWY